MCESASTWVVVEAVDVEAEAVARRLVAGDPVRVAGVARREHVVVDGLGVLGRRRGGQVVGQADRDAVAHERAPPRRRRSGVRWLRAPRSSSAPHRPQLLTDSYQASSSAVVGTVMAR